jgi:hypothetical protein
MQYKQNILATFIKASLCALFALGFLAQTQAEDKKADPAGTWTWTRPGRNGGPDQKLTLKLKTEGDKVTGVLISPGRQGGDPTETKIEDAKLNGDEICFTVTREFNGNKMVTKYNGKLTADSIKGKAEFERNGEKQSRDWEAKRATDAK